MNEEIKLINEIILNSEKNGADAGGSYRQNIKGLTQSMMNYLKHKNLTHEYGLKEVDIDGWKVFQFIKVKE